MSQPFEQYFKSIYQHAPANSLIAWGDLYTPLYIPVGEYFGVVGDIPQDKNMYYTPAVLSAQARTKDNTIGASVLWADVDDYKDHNTLPLLPPTFVINSGRGKHLIYLLDKFYPADQIEAGNKTLADHLKLKGQSCWNVNRLLRVPGSNNCKYKEGIEGYDSPLPCVVEHANYHHIYRLDQLLKIKQYRDNLLVIGEKESRSERDQRLAVLLLGWGLPEDYVKMALLFHSDKARDEPGHYVDFTIEKANQWVSKKAKQSGGGGGIGADQLANVDFTPSAWLVSPDGRELGLTIKLTWGAKTVIAGATSENFANRGSIIRWLTEHTATRTFFGSDAKALALWGHLTELCPLEKRQLQVPSAGRYDLRTGQSIYIYSPNQSITDEGEVSVFWQPDIKINSGLYLGDADENVDMKEYSGVLAATLKTQPPEVIYPALGWVIASVFKPLFETFGASMPLLMLYGTRGSGKTTVIQDVLLPMIGAFTKPIASDITPFALAGHLGLTNAWPVWVGEYRASNHNSDVFQQLLRSAYDSGTMERGRPNQTVASYNLVAPVIVDGESPFSEPANLDRSVSLHLAQNTIQPGTVYEQSYQQLKTWDNLQRGKMARHFITWSLSKKIDQVKSYFQTGYEVLDGHSLTARSLNNLAIVWAGLMLLEDYVIDTGLEVDLKHDPDVLVRVALNTHIPGLGTKTQIDALVEQVTHFHLLPDLETDWDVHSGILWFNMTRVIHTLRVRTDPRMLSLQLQERVGHYITGPSRRRGGAEYWGIEIDKAQKFGLDIFKPEPLRGIEFPMSIEV